MSGSNCCLLTAYRFLRGQVKWSGIPISLRIFQFVVIHTVKGFSIVNEAGDVSLELPCFFYYLMDVGNLISGSSAFSKSSLYVLKFLVHILLKSSLKDFEQYLLNVKWACEMSTIVCSLNILWHCLSLGSEWKLTFSCPVTYFTK